MKNKCCNELTARIEDGNILLSDEVPEIYGHPRMVGGGDDVYTYDMTEGFVISFCPFCGTDLRKI